MVVVETPAAAASPVEDIYIVEESGRETGRSTGVVLRDTERSTNAILRATDRSSGGIILPATYDEKDDLDLLRAKLQKRKRPIYAGLAFLCVVVIGVSIAVTSGGDSTEVNTGAGVTPAPTTPAPSGASNEAGEVHGFDLSGLSSGSGSGALTPAPLEDRSLPSNSSSGSNATEAPEQPLLPYKAVDFNWKDTSNWQYSGGRGIPGGMFSDEGIKLTSANSPEPIRTKMGWGGEKIVFFEWERSDSSDTNIWMLNTKIREQFGTNNGWPYWGEIDIFEMFTQDAKTYGESGFTSPLGGVTSYGQLTLHNGPATGQGKPCFCPSRTGNSWFQSAPMVTSCGAQFANTPKNSMATIWGRDGNGQFIQLYQNPTITKGGKTKDGQQTYDITPGGTVTAKIYNNAALFWGTPSSSDCAKAGGHNPATGFPFFEDFYITLEEQKKNDGGAWFKVTNIQIFRK